jgi:signal peptidase II
MLALLTFAAVILFADQASKRAVRRQTAPNQCGPFLCIRQVSHREQLYEQTVSRMIFILVWFAALLSTAWLKASGVWLHSPVAAAGVGCALGGAAGNLLDILQRRHITNFIDLGWWPLFNFADVAIVGGLMLAFLA